MPKVEQIAETYTNKNTNKSKNDKIENKKISSIPPDGAKLNFLHREITGHNAHTQTKQTKIKQGLGKLLSLSVSSSLNMILLYISHLLAYRIMFDMKQRTHPITN